MLEGGGIYRLGDDWYPVTAGRLHLDGAVLPAVVRRDGQDAGEVPHLQGLEPGRPVTPSHRRGIGSTRGTRRARGASRTAAAPAVTRVVFTDADLRARACVQGLCAEAGPVGARGRGRQHVRALGRRRPGAAGRRHRLAHRRDPARRQLRRHRRRARRARGDPRAAARRRSRRGGRSSWCCSPPKSRRGSASAASAAGCLPGCSTRRRAAGCAIATARRSTRRGSGPASAATSRPCALPAGHYAAFVELHIEQGPLLERDGIGLGIVTAIAAPASLRVVIEGEGGHAGAVLMPDRRDAFLAGAEIALAVEAAAQSDRRRSTPSPRPASATSFPARSTASRAAATSRSTSATSIGAPRCRARRTSPRPVPTWPRGAACRIDTRSRQCRPAARCDATVVDALAASCEARACAASR